MTKPDEYQPHRSLIYGLPFLSAASLVFEIHLTRIFSVAQFYHFAFMIISIAFLGYGASGPFLAIFPAIQEKTSKNTFSVLALFTGVSMLISYIVLNWLPFDSFSITWDRRQFVLLVIDYMALTVPYLLYWISGWIAIIGLPPRQRSDLFG